MSRFDQRWRCCLQVARRASPRPLPEPPTDLAETARRLGAGSGPGQDDWELIDWWRWYGTRGLAVATAILVSCVLVVIGDGREAPSLRPGVEDAVAEVLWRL